MDEPDPRPVAPGGLGLYVRLDDVEEGQLVTDVREADWSEELPVALGPLGPWMSLGDAVENSGRVRDALLRISPDERVERGMRLRALALGAPVAFAFFAVNEIQETGQVASDAKRVLGSEAFRAAETDSDPRVVQFAKTRREKIERAVGMRWGTVAIEAAFGLLALLVVLVGLRRLRPLVLAAGAASCSWWLFQAGRPDRCFHSPRHLALSLMGLSGFVAALLLWPSERRVTRSLRERLGLDRPPSTAVAPTGLRMRDKDLVALVAAAWLGVLLPFLLRWLGEARVPDTTRAFVFVFYCLGAFLGFLAFRKEVLSRVRTSVGALILAGVVGFGFTVVCDVASRTAFGTYVEAKQCQSPEAGQQAKKVQEQSAKETTTARKDTQASALAFFITVLAAPLSEEMLYRGTVQRLARRRFGARWAMAISALLFGVAHALAFPTAFYQHFGLGLAFAVVFELGGGGAMAVVASALTHALWNGWLALSPVF
ncbi:MAG: CPBP family intramembrane metalloprotease [Myxococcales bacterium]|nr:CPBP family intramembrane metalloprotease [Myxococcales bacterium]